MGPRRGDDPAGTRPFAFFVKTVRPWELSPLFEQVPPELRASAATSFPWRTEPAVYRSDLADVLPPGLRMPHAYDVADLPGPMAALWLEVVPTEQHPWTRERFAAAARALGRLAGSAATRGRALVGDFPLTVRSYLDGRVAGQVLPVLRSSVWEHPGLTAFADLRAPLLAAVEDLPDLVAELEALPSLAAHGDACPNNLLPDPDDVDGFVLIDFGLWNLQPVAHDLTQLLVGDIQIGRRPADDLVALDELVLAAYADGLAAEGTTVDAATLRRAHALQLFLFAGLSALPFDLLDGPPERVAALAPARAAITAHALDSLARSAGRAQESSRPG